MEARIQVAHFSPVCEAVNSRMSAVLVIGHKNPDTDAICSAIGYAEFKRRTGMENAVAARCGDINDRIDFVLKHFGVPPPRFVTDVSPLIRDVMQENVMSVPPTATVAQALGLMDERNLRVLPILSDNGCCLGLVSVFKMSKFFFPAPHRPFDSRRVVASVRNLAATLNGQLIFGVDSDQEEDLLLMIGAMSLPRFAERLPQYPREKLIVVVGDRREILERAVSERVRLVVVTGGLSIDTDILDLAREYRVSMISSPHDTATTAMLCRTAITVRHMMHEYFLSFRDDEHLDRVKDVAAASQFQAFPVLDANHRTVGVLSKSDFLRKVERKLILVDHNELSQAVQGADKVEILEIIDHHRIGTYTTQQPILFRNQPVGSTSTIVAQCFFEQNLEIPPEIAGLLLAGIVSDTLNLTSPTTTSIDVHMLGNLEKISGVNAREFTERLFSSGSLLIAKPASQAITTDCKEYEEKGHRFSVAQIEEIGFDQFWKRKNDVLVALQQYRKENGYFFSALLVTDIVRQSSLLLVKGDERIQSRIDYPELESDIYELKGVVSRKKQLLPFLIHCLELAG